MHVRILAVGDRQPSWVDTAFASYATRLPRQWDFRLDTLASGKRGKGKTQVSAKEDEGVKILARTRPADFVIALDESGKQCTSRELAGQMETWQVVGADLIFVIGGPDGLSGVVLQRANYCLGLSKMTLPHGLARLLVVEQLYRAWSLMSGHPYHRD